MWVSIVGAEYQQNNFEAFSGLGKCSSASVQVSLFLEPWAIVSATHHVPWLLYCRALNNYQYHGPIFVVWLPYHLPQIYLRMRWGTTVASIWQIPKIKGPKVDPRNFGLLLIGPPPKRTPNLRKQPYYMNRTPKDHINIRILQIMFSGMPFTLGPGNRM